MRQMAAGNPDFLLKGPHIYSLTPRHSLCALVEGQQLRRGWRYTRRDLICVASRWGLEGQLSLSLCWVIPPQGQIWKCINLVNSASSSLLAPWDPTPSNSCTSGGSYDSWALWAPNRWGADLRVPYPFCWAAPSSIIVVAHLNSQCRLLPCSTSSNAGSYQLRITL